MQARDLERYINICDAHQYETNSSCKTCPISEICKKEGLKKLYNVKTISELKLSGRN